jgi:hypothetical protein
MSLVAFRYRKHVKLSDVPDRSGQGRITFPAPAGLGTLAGPLQRAVRGAARLFGQATQAFAEARMHRAMIEAELYHGRYRLSSKNDDDLPIVSRTER